MNAHHRPLTMRDALSDLFYAVGRVLEASGEPPFVAAEPVGVAPEATSRAKDIGNALVVIADVMAPMPSAPSQDVFPAEDEDDLPPEPEAKQPEAKQPEAKRPEAKKPKKKAKPAVQWSDDDALIKVKGAKAYNPTTNYGVLHAALPGGRFAYKAVVEIAQNLARTGDLNHRYSAQRAANTFLGHAISMGRLRRVGSRA